MKKITIKTWSSEKNGLGIQATHEVFASIIAAARFLAKQRKLTGYLGSEIPNAAMARKVRFFADAL